MNESKNLACRVRPILDAIIEEARNQHADILTEGNWNPDYTLEISLRVREIRALAQLLKAGGQQPATPETVGVKALASAQCSPSGWEKNRTYSWNKFCERFQKLHPFIKPDFQNEEHRKLFSWYDGGIIDEAWSQIERLNQKTENG